MRPQKDELDDSDPAVLRRAGANGSHEKIRLLRLMVMRLQEELESLNEVPALDVELGLNFYEEVRNFEIELIKRALLLKGGHQGKAAQLLHMNPTTLNAKIKYYNIKLGLHAHPATEHWNNGEAERTFGKDTDSIETRNSSC